MEIHEPPGEVLHEIPIALDGQKIALDRLKSHIRLRKCAGNNEAQTEQQNDRVTVYSRHGVPPLNLRRVEPFEL
jgi:hypothetical protein